MSGGGTTHTITSRPFLREVAAWSVPVAVAAAVIGTLVSHDYRFGASCVIGAVADIATVLPIADGDPSREAPAGRLVGTAGLLFGGRFLLKAVLLSLAVAFPGVLSLTGMAVGVLVFDTTLLTAGAAVSAVRSMRSI